MTASSPEDPGAQLAAAQDRVRALERALEEQSQALRAAIQELHRAEDRHERLRRTMPGCLMSLSVHGTVTEANVATHDLVERTEADLVGLPVTALFAPGDAPDLGSIAAWSRRGAVLRAEKLLLTRSGMVVPVLLSASALFEHDDLQGFVAVMQDLREQKALEAELRHAQKLEAVGQLAAGIAHEINTPSQYVGDSVWFARDALGDLVALLDRYRDAARGAVDARTLRALDQAEINSHYAFIRQEVPNALASALGGVKRIEEIVTAMKTFARPNLREKSPTDLNESIRTALTIARHAYKYVAEVETDLQPLPPVLCHMGDIHQVLVSLVVNAAHAIEGASANTQDRGRIRIESRYVPEGAAVTVSVTDSGGEIPDEVAHRVFDPYFSTRGIGRGRAQGLYIARQIVVERHGGSLTFETEPGHGTTFTLRLPRDGGGRTYSEVAA